MASGECAASASRTRDRNSAVTQSSKSSSFESELRDDTDPPAVVHATTAQIIDDQATTAGHRRHPHSNKAKGDGRTDPQKADSDMTTMTIMFTMLAAYFYFLNEKTSREHGAFDTLDSCHSGASTAHDLCQIWDSRPRPHSTASISVASTSMTDHYSTASMTRASTTHGPCHGSWGARTRSTASVSGASTDLKRYPVPSDEKTDAGTTNEN